MTDINTVVEKYKSRQALIGIVGLGYVGLPLMLRYNAIGFNVLGIDIDQSKVDKLNAGQSYIEHIPAANIAKARQSGFEATIDFERASECDALILCVPTPLNKYREPDLSFVINTTDALKPYLRAGQVVSSKAPLTRYYRRRAAASRAGRRFGCRREYLPRLLAGA